MPPHPLREGVISSHYYYYYRGTRSMQKKINPHAPLATPGGYLSPHCPSVLPGLTPNFPPSLPAAPLPTESDPVPQSWGMFPPSSTPHCGKAIPSSPPELLWGRGRNPHVPALSPLPPAFPHISAGGVLDFSLFPLSERLKNPIFCPFRFKINTPTTFLQPSPGALPCVGEKEGKKPSDLLAGKLARGLVALVFPTEGRCLLLPCPPLPAPEGGV